MNDLFPDSRLQGALQRLLSHCHRRDLPARTTFIHPGDPPDTLYYMVSGTATVVRADEEGRELIMAYLGAGEFIGAIGLFHPLDSLGVLIRTHSRSEVAAITYARFKALLGRELAADQGPLLYMLGAQLGQRMLQSSRKLSLMAYNDVHSRVEAALYELTRGPTAEVHPQGMRIRISRTEISRVVGCSREVVGKVLKNLEQQGAIAVSGQNVLVYHAPRGQVGAEGHWRHQGRKIFCKESQEPLPVGTG